MNLDLFDRKNRNSNSSINKFIEELKNVFKNMIEKERKASGENKILEEYNLYEKRKIFLDNKSWKGNDLLWVMDEKSVCVSVHGEGGPYHITEINLPENAKIGDVYKKVNGEYIYSPDITMELQEIT